MHHKMEASSEYSGLIVDPASGRIEYKGITAIPSIRLSNVNSVYEILSSSRLFLDTNFVISAAERNYVQHQVFVFRERALRKQQLIERDLRLAQQTGDWALYLECRRDLKKLNRQSWSLGSVLKSKVLVRRKGTERSRSRSGSQTICTHTTPIFEEDSEQRWLLGLAVEISRAANLRNRVDRRVPIKARTGAQSLETKYFAKAKTNVRKSRFRTQISAATPVRQRKQMDLHRSRRGADLPPGNQDHYRYACNQRQRLSFYGLSSVGMVCLRHLDRRDGYLRTESR
jgi:hypothetical protein